MTHETVFRALFILAFIFMLGIRLYYQSKVLHNRNRLDIRENILSLAAGSIAALTTIIFGAEYIFFPGSFPFTYILPYPAWLRWLGAIFLAGGIFLLWSAHHHLNKNFHSLVVSKQQQSLVESGPYRRIRHPIYTSYIINYIGGGLLSGSLVLTIVPVIMFSLMIASRLGREEALLSERFGQDYLDYMQRTGRLLPPIGLSRLLGEIKYDLSFIKSHTLQPEWYKRLKIVLLAGFAAVYWIFFGLEKTVLFFAVFFSLNLCLHLLYRIKTNRYTRSWLDFAVVQEDGAPARRIGWFYYPAVLLNTVIALIISQRVA